MIRIREIRDVELREKIRETLARRRDMSPASIPDWFELDDADFVDLLNEMKEPDEEGKPDYDPRM